MIKKKPVIAVTGPDKGGLPAWLFTWLAVKRAGGIAKRVTPSKMESIPEFDGLIIGGGADINPELYDSEPINEIKNLADEEKKRTGFKRFFYILLSVFIVILRKISSGGHTAPIDLQRDQLEKKTLEIALEKNLPILGICRGAQFINIHFGGDLHQDIGEYYTEIPKVDTIYPKKEVVLSSGTKLAGILGKEKTMVNSLHNQAVHKSGEEIIISAKEHTGITQAIEHKTLPFVIGIQWHPEYLPQIKTQQKLFKALVKEATN